MSRPLLVGASVRARACVWCVRVWFVRVCVCVSVHM